MATSHQAQVSDPEYHNWVRCVLGLKYTQEGLYPFIDNEAREFHKNLTANISTQLGVQSLNCNQCTINTILPSHSSGTCPVKKRNSACKKNINCICTNVQSNRRFCPAGICGRFYDGIVSAHRYRDPAWWNSDMKQWNVSPWEVAKTFLPSTGGYTQISKAADTDCSGLLNIAINMENIANRHGITSAPGVFEKCRTARNVILHSSSQKLSDSDRDDFIQTMVDVLECTQALKTDQAAQLAVTKLQQVKSNLYIVTTADIQEAEIKAYEKEKAEFKQRLIQMVQERFVSTPVAECMPDMVSVEKLFVKPYFKIMEVNVFSDNKAEHEANSMKDLFFKEDNLCKRIYVTGDAGSGKTTFCRQIAHSWTHIHSETDKCDSDSVCSEYMEVMKHFDFVFYLPIRSFCHMYRVEEMLQSHYFPNREDFLGKVLSRESCLVVLDGLDEWGPPESYQQPVSGTYGLPDFGDIFPYTALVTTRPWKLETLRLNSTEIDLQVKLDGIHRAQAKELSQKMVECLNKATNSEKKFPDFEKQLHKSKLDDFMQIPILLKQLVILWHRRNTFGNSLAEIYSEMIDLMLEQSQVRNKGMPLSEPLGSKEESNNVELPTCFESTEYCLDHVGILYPLAKVAFKTLFNKNQTCALVFRHNANVHGFSKLDMELLLKTGILSQHIDFSCDVKKHKYLSFLHKSIQEFLAAVYICISDSDACLRQVFDVCKSWDIVLQMKAVFVFISGWNGDIAEKIPKFMQSVIDNHKPENYLIDNDFYYFEFIQKFMIECLEESSKLNSLPVWKTETIHINTMRNLKYVKHLIQRNDIKCVYVNLFLKTVSESELQEPLSDLTLCPSIHTVIMYPNEHSSQELTTQLCKALLYDRTLTYFIIELSYLEKENEKMFCEHVFNYLRNDDLTALRKLSVINGKLFYQSNSDMQKTLQQIGTAVSLNALSLNGIGCSDHGENCTCILDLTKQAKLKELDIRNLHIGQVKLDSSQLTSCAVGSLPVGSQASLLHSLHSASSLQFLSLRDILDENTDLVASLLQCLTNLTHLKLTDMNFNERKISLSLEATHIQFILLNHVNISDESLIYFCKTIPATQHKVCVTVLPYGEMDAFKKYVEENMQMHDDISDDISLFGFLSFSTVPDKQADVIYRRQANNKWRNPKMHRNTLVNHRPFASCEFCRRM